MIFYVNSWLFSLVHVPSTNMEEAGVMTCIADSRQVAIKMLWPHFVFVMSSIFTYRESSSAGSQCLASFCSLFWGPAPSLLFFSVLFFSSTWFPFSRSVGYTYVIKHYWTTNYRRRGNVRLTANRSPEMWLLIFLYIQWMCNNKRRVWDCLLTTCYSKGSAWLLDLYLKVNSHHHTVICDKHIADWFSSIICSPFLQLRYCGSSCFKIPLNADLMRTWL